MNGLPTGEIIRFFVTARCPYCDKETEVCRSEAADEEVSCQHCEEVFNICLDD